MSKVKRASMRAVVRNIRRRTPGPTETHLGSIEVRELDPVRKCGPGTSVRLLYRVIERGDGELINHLVFFDRHGWYCEHGRTCPAVGLARKRAERLAR